MRTLWVAGIVVILMLMVHSRPPVGFGAAQEKDKIKPGMPGLKGEASCGFLPVAVPGGQGGRPIFVIPEEVIAIRSNNVDNTSTTIFFRHHHTIQVSAPDTDVLKALQSGKRVRQDGK